MSDNITFNPAHAGYNASKYLPGGPVKDVVPYLIRRAQEEYFYRRSDGPGIRLIRSEMKRRKIYLPKALPRAMSGFFLFYTTL